jgi:AcrR family transcriptional regulator
VAHTTDRRAVRSRAEQKGLTRQALLDAALDLLVDQGLSSLSLREVTRAAGVVPAAFYRHFPDIPALGVALVEESLGSLRGAARMVRTGLTGSDELIEQSMGVLVAEIRARPAGYRFIARERYGGVAVVRRAIEEQLRRSADELATDLLGSDMDSAAYLRDWPADEVRMATALIVNHMWQTAAALLDTTTDPAAEAALRATATRQLRVIVLGCRGWQP